MQQRIMCIFGSIAKPIGHRWSLADMQKEESENNEKKKEQCGHLLRQYCFCWDSVTNKKSVQHCAAPVEKARRGRARLLEPGVVRLSLFFLLGVKLSLSRSSYAPGKPSRGARVGRDHIG
ncbi:hypothetical protein TW95_gp1827 [Pandoravirus inopinatum]|uniref:Uncharacterized protein n=1 Tax=Pandoravirus inopinatum TaxID=1605721 RepID=A0A0B5JBZ8_9VIRU|nr:hypothetical protein TW95_gp1827 [Pandoravirus inopinatum]AJF98561.1 hypothetical protein [Pandoravirus inopinatum]